MSTENTHTEAAPEPKPLFLIPVAVTADDPVLPPSAAEIVLKITSREQPVFEAGERAYFTIRAEQGGQLLKQGRLTVEFSNSGHQILQETEIDFAESNPACLDFTLTDPGFLWVRGKRFTGGPAGGKEPELPFHSAVFSWEKIVPGMPEPDDFISFWQRGLAAVKEAPVEVAPFPGHDYPDHTPYLASVDVPGQGKVHAIFLIPKTAGKHALWINIPGAGAGDGIIGTPPDWADRIIACINVHKFSPVADAAEMDARLKKYVKEFGEYPVEHADDPEKYFFRRVFTGMSRLIDYLCTRPEWDGRNVIVFGSSQGGASTMAMAALNKHVSAASINVPAMCDHFGWKFGRAPGWPYFHERVPGSDLTARYFDTVNFARHVKVPVLLAVGFLDTAAPAAGGCAAFNQLTKEKQFFPMYFRGHEIPPEFARVQEEFLQKHLLR